ncbi:hypothetical protein GCM10007108_08700 [Thermogymnomonas acidicola]|uniref:Bacterial type II secretion system protein E domain-containing protein n=2 Tax=Thermogymnomonas acidicola TaxID=399579 RepID=A0AA37F9B8_9ARCH|nr:type II/IV secretion system ATPase subunit [Thermogymnomonas acidicola]GGM72868.1 hypothetical protein GCM10007108_08700 [Thermogymnomonas acidicola]
MELQESGLLTTYTVYDNYRVDIVREGNGIFYVLNGPEYSAEERRCISEVRKRYTAFLRSSSGMEDGRKVIDDLIMGVAANGRIRPQLVRQRLLMEFFEYGDITPIFHDPNVEDISCNGPGRHVYVYHSSYGSLKTNLVLSQEQVDSLVIRFATLSGSDVSMRRPILDGVTHGGHRVQAIYGREISPLGSCFTVRVFRERPLTPVDLMQRGTVSEDILVYLWYMVQMGRSAVIAGPPASGKTTLLNSILMFVPENTKVFSIEESREIRIEHPDWVPSVVRRTGLVSDAGVRQYELFDLVKIAMRQRPTYIVLGEIRGRESYAIFQAMSTGHTSYTTIHAESMENLVHRLEGEPHRIPRAMMLSMDTVVFVNFSGNRRVVTSIYETVDIDPSDSSLIVNRVFSLDKQSGRHVFHGRSVLYRVVEEKLGRERFAGDMERKRQVLREAFSSGVSDYRRFMEMVRNASTS